MNLSKHSYYVKTRGVIYELLYIIRNITGAGSNTRIWDMLEKRDSRYYAGLSYDKLRFELCKTFKEQMGYDLNLDNPKTFNEKIQWSKLNDRDPMRTRLSDKEAVRDWVIQKLGTDKYCIRRYGTWDSFDDICFDELPDAFILKTNHGFATNVIVKDKNKMDKKACKRQFDRWMKKSFFGWTMEYQYLGIPPKIICEELLFTDKDDLPDYKFFCFDGKVFCSYLMEDYTLDPHNGRLGFLDRDWNLMPYHKKQYKPLEAQPPKPANYEKMLEIAETLSEGFPHVRVDLYNIDGKIYFGEMTFTTTAGYGAFEPPEFDRILGEQWRI